jgi:hypothetical protein
MAGPLHLISRAVLVMTGRLVRPAFSFRVLPTSDFLTVVKFLTPNAACMPVMPMMIIIIVVVVVVAITEVGVMIDISKIRAFWPGCGLGNLDFHDTPQ